MLQHAAVYLAREDRLSASGHLYGGDVEQWFLLN